MSNTLTLTQYFHMTLHGKGRHLNIDMIKIGIKKVTFTYIISEEVSRNISTNERL